MGHHGSPLPGQACGRSTTRKPARERPSPRHGWRRPETASAVVSSLLADTRNASVEGGHPVGRPVTPLLSVEGIIDAASEIMALQGDFTMQKVAHNLQVRQSALYNHVTGRRHIIELMRERIFKDFLLPAPLPAWRAIEHGARQYHGACARHSRLVAVLAASPLVDPAAGRIRQYWAENLAAAGFDGTKIQLIITTLDRFILGSVLAEEGARRMDRSGTENLTPTMATGLTQNQEPDSFDFGISVLLSGLEPVRNHT